MTWLVQIISSNLRHSKQKISARRVTAATFFCKEVILGSHLLILRILSRDSQIREGLCSSLLAQTLSHILLYVLHLCPEER